MVLYLVKSRNNTITAKNDDENDNDTAIEAPQRLSSPSPPDKHDSSSSCCCCLFGHLVCATIGSSSAHQQQQQRRRQQYPSNLQQQSFRFFLIGSIVGIVLHVFHFGVSLLMLLLCSTRQVSSSSSSSFKGGVFGDAAVSTTTSTSSSHHDDDNPSTAYYCDKAVNTFSTIVENCMFYFQFLVYIVAFLVYLFRTRTSYSSTKLPKTIRTEEIFSNHHKSQKTGNDYNTLKSFQRCFLRHWEKEEEEDGDKIRNGGGGGGTLFLNHWSAVPILLIISYVCGVFFISHSITLVVLAIVE